MQTHLRTAGVETLIHYPIPIPQQQAVASEDPAACPVAARVCCEVFSLPLYPTLLVSGRRSLPRPSQVAAAPGPQAQPELLP